MGANDLDLAGWFGNMAHDLSSRDNVADTLHEICRLARDAIEACQAAGITQVHRRQRIEVPAATNETAERLHTLQYELGDGPCMDAAWEHHTVQIDDMTVEKRWPRFAAQATRMGVRSMLCLQLFTHEDTLGALNLFSDRPRAFDEHDRELGLIFASHAAVALAGAQKEAGLEAAVRTRQIIGEASGILSERHDVTTTDAFRMLVKVSQDHNIKLRELAERLVKSEDGNRGKRYTAPRLQQRPG